MRRLVLGMTVLFAVGCDNAGSDLGLPQLAEGGVLIGIYLDRDGNATLSPADTVFEGARVALFLVGSDDTVDVVTTDANGLAEFLNVPVGRYRFAVVRSSLGDSLPVVEGDTVTLRLTANPDSLGDAALVRVGYREMTLPEVRTATAGQRVIVRGIVSSAMQFFRDSASFLAGQGAYLRVTSTSHRPGRDGNNPGDSVSVLGTTGSNAGQPVLLNGLVQSITERPAPVPVEVSVAEVKTARGGELDAALVRVASTTIVDTATVNTDFHVRVAVGTDTALVVIDAKLQAVPALFVPGRILTTRGVLVPKGDGTWFLKPRPVSGEIIVDPAPAP